MSLIQSAKLNGHDPHAYLKDVLTRLPTHMNSRHDELLPHRWSPAWCPHVHDKTVDTYLLAGADKRKSRWDGRTNTFRLQKIVNGTCTDIDTEVLQNAHKN